MPTVLTRTVKSSGGDYSSLSAAEAGEQGDLTSLDRQLDIACYSFQDTTAVAIGGWTTDATRYIRIFTPSGERHDGKWNTSKYRLSVSAEFNYPLILSEEFVRLEGIQIEQTHSNGVACVQTTGVAAAASSDNRLTECLLRTASTRTTADTGSVIQHGAGKLTLRNSVIYKGGASGVHTAFGSNAPTLVADNCTLAGNGAYGVNRTSGTVTLQNCYSGGNGTDAYNGTITRTTCAHSSATVFTGSTASVPHSTATFTNVTAGSEDYHLVSGSALIDAGTDLSGTFTTDIDGATRSGTWDIGADEFVGGIVASASRLMLLGVG